MLAILKSSVDSIGKSEQHILASSRLNLDQFMMSSPSRQEVLVRVRTAAVEVEARELGASNATPDDLACYVSHAILAFMFLPLFMPIQSRYPEEKVFTFSDNLKGMNGNKGSFFGSDDDILTGF
ncbi:hypothetical protein FVE85_7859 [Porphyridium purpureum]|uniref:Uncharacterized protein n=1 Tax=Porphyridium purpureum TaxID=35688 RepID=A0A5J4YH78_PORPP|nr:hypothetical protein FVE85_7859 [Porphyridium purpureum]|eukprot:POR1908..scf271_22